VRSDAGLAAGEAADGDSEAGEDAVVVVEGLAQAPSISPRAATMLVCFRREESFCFKGALEVLAADWRSLDMVQLTQEKIIELDSIG
jgi:hypothetical protein